MSDEKKFNIDKVDTPAGLTNDQIFKLLMESQKQLADALKEQSAAILESRKPYVDPKVIAAQQAANEERRREVKTTFLTRAATKAQCPHTRINSDAQGNNTFADKLNIKWQEHSNGIILGVCGTCFSQFDARNSEDRKFLMRDGNAISNMGHARARGH